MEFPILQPKANGPRLYVPWDFVKPHRHQIERNHYQSIDRVAERGGLSWVELYYVIRSEKFPMRNSVSTDEARKYVTGRVDEWKNAA